MIRARARMHRLWFDVNHHMGYTPPITIRREELDRILSDLSGMITSTSISKRVEELKNKVSKDGEAGLDEFELNDYILISTFTSTVDAFGATVKFDEAEPDLNRHWIAHGRMTRSIEKIDCIRIINMLYGTLLMAKLGGKDE